MYFVHHCLLSTIFPYLLHLPTSALHLGKTSAPNKILQYCIHSYFFSAILIFSCNYRRHGQLHIVMHIFLFLKCIIPLKILHFVSRFFADNAGTDLQPPALAKHYFVSQYFQEQFFLRTVNEKKQCLTNGVNSFKIIFNCSEKISTF